MWSSNILCCFGQQSLKDTKKIKRQSFCEKLTLLFSLGLELKAFLYILKKTLVFRLKYASVLRWSILEWEKEFSHLALWTDYMNIYSCPREMEVRSEKAVAACGLQGRSKFFRTYFLNKTFLNISLILFFHEKNLIQRILLRTQFCTKTQLSSFSPNSDPINNGVCIHAKMAGEWFHCILSFCTVHLRSTRSHCRSVSVTGTGRWREKSKEHAGR